MLRAATTVDTPGPPAPAEGRAEDAWTLGGGLATGVAVGFVAAVGVCLPAWHVITRLLPDSYMTLYVGRWVALHGIPHRETLTLAASGRPWIAQQWLASLIDFETWRLGGLRAVGLLAGALTAAAFGGLAAIMRSRGSSVVLAVACSLVAMVVALPGLFIHAENFAVPLFVLVLGLCFEDARHEVPRRSLLLMIPALVLWANLHGTVLIGAGLSAGYLAYRAVLMAAAGRGRAGGVYAAMAIAAALSPLATPYGVQIVNYYRDLLGNPAVAAAAPANRAPTLSGSAALLLLTPLTLAALALLRSVLNRRRVWPPLVVATAATGFATLLASRSLVWFAITAMVLVAEVARDWLPTRRPSLRFLAALAGISLTVGVGGVALITSHSDRQYEAYTPLRAIAAAARVALARPELRLLGDNAAASALLWHYPQLTGRVGYDARLERYRELDLRRWIAFQEGTGRSWAATASGYQLLVGSATFDPDLVRRLATMPGGVDLAHDADGIAILVTRRTIPAGA